MTLHWHNVVETQTFLPTKVVLRIFFKALAMQFKVIYNRVLTVLDIKTTWRVVKDNKRLE